MKEDKDDLLPLIPFKIPFVGSTFAYYANPPKFTIENTRRFGSVFRMHMHGDIATVVGSKDAPEVFNHPSLSFSASQGKFLDNVAFHGEGEFTLPKNVITHVVMKYLTPNLKLHSPRSFEKFLSSVQQIKEDEFTKDNLLPFIRGFVARYSATAFVGAELSENLDLMNAFENAVSDISHDFRPGVLRVIFPTLNHLYMRYFNRKGTALKKYRTMIKGALEQEIIRREKNGLESEEDALGYLLKAYPHEINNAHLETLTTVCLILIFVGVHTTSEATTYVMYRLVKHPKYIQDLREEQEEAIQREIGTEYNRKEPVIYTPNIYRHLQKLDSFIHECMRTKMNGIGLGHKNIGQDDIQLQSGATVQPGKEVFINMWHVNHDPQNLSGQQDLDKFRGFRFVGQDKLVTKTGHDNISFGMGKHACPGRWFAVHQIKGIVSFFIRHYDMSAVSEIKIMGAESDYIGTPQGSILFSRRTNQ
ncbi:Ent-kaurene oxidase [Choanephora cucurbitarum]|uniref:Ent-kaurene oxidase n=1 Tax=Choanephora cucurbitarum TaxID=101091 RepID=A0A1C7NFX3_9FUNG|nr:Ent-kaurene oxidase [Choanephora cucurbitarum]